MPLLPIITGPVLAIWLLAIAVIDWRTQRIPDVLSLPLIAAGIAFAWAHPQQDVMIHLIGACAGYVPLALFGEAFFRLRGVEGLGLGDAKLFGAAGAWLGWAPLPYVLLIAAGAGLVAALLVRDAVDRDGRIAFGPFIAGAFFLVWILVR